MKHLDQDAVLDYDRVKTPDYFAGARQDWIDQLPTGQGLNILELGCGYGETGAYAFNNGICDTYYGIEIAVSAAEQARQNLTGVIVGDATHVDLPFKRGQFDALLMSEVLEHLVDPWAVLKRLLPLVKPGGMIFASSPNVAHKDILKELIAGTWDLTDAGPKDRTHLRWFTPVTYRKMFEDLDVHVDSVGALNPSRTLKQRLFGMVTGHKFDHLFSYQINLVGRMNDETNQR